MEKLRMWANWLWGIIAALLGLSAPNADSSALRKAYEAQATYIEAQNVYVAVQEQIITNLLEERIFLMWVSLVLMVLFNILSYTGLGKHFFEWGIDILFKGWDCLKKSKIAQGVRKITNKKTRGE